MTPLSTESTTARATAACAGPNICTACAAPLIVTLLKRLVPASRGWSGARRRRGARRRNVHDVNEPDAVYDVDPSREIERIGMESKAVLLGLRYDQSDSRIPRHRWAHASALEIEAIDKPLAVLR